MPRRAAAVWTTLAMVAMVLGSAGAGVVPVPRPPMQSDGAAEPAGNFVALQLASTSKMVLIHDPSDAMWALALFLFVTVIIRLVGFVMNMFPTKDAWDKTTLQHYPGPQFLYEQLQQDLKKIDDSTTGKKEWASKWMFWPDWTFEELGHELRTLYEEDAALGMATWRSSVVNDAGSDLSALIRRVENDAIGGTAWNGAKKGEPGNEVVSEGPSLRRKRVGFQGWQSEGPYGPVQLNWMHSFYSSLLFALEMVQKENVKNAGTWEAWARADATPHTCKAHLILVMIMHLIDQFQEFRHIRYLELGMNDLARMPVCGESDLCTIDKKMQETCEGDKGAGYKNAETFVHALILEDDLIKWAGLKTLSPSAKARLKKPGHPDTMKELVRAKGLTAVHISDLLEALLDKYDDLVTPSGNALKIFRRKDVLDYTAWEKIADPENHNLDPNVFACGGGKHARASPDSDALTVCGRWFDPACVAELGSAIREVGVAPLGNVDAPTDSCECMRNKYITDGVQWPFVQIDGILRRKKGKALVDYYKAFGSSKEELWETVCHKTLLGHEFCHAGDSKYKMFEVWQPGLANKGTGKSDLVAVEGYVRMLGAKNSRMYDSLALATADIKGRELCKGKDTAECEPKKLDAKCTAG